MDNLKDQKLKALAFLRENRLGVVSTISYENQKPEGSLVYYVVDTKNIYFITPRQSRKLANLNQNNKIAFTIFTEIPPQELQLEGNVESIDDPDQKSYITKIYLDNANKNSETINWPPVLKVPNDEGFIFVKVTIDWFKFSDFRNIEGNIVEGTTEDWS